ncbi:hypothetical protein P7C70_g4733, partial [Phenoliferia sp. Uapishka_3]
MISNSNSNPNFGAFSSPLGPLHLAPPSVSSTFLTSLIHFTTKPFSNKRSSSSSSSLKKTSPSKDTKLPIQYAGSSSKSNYYPTVASRSLLPPTYDQAVGVEENLEFGDEGIMGQEEHREKGLTEEQKRMLERDRLMGEAFRSMGL